MKALWQGEMRLLMSGARRKARTLVMIFATPWMRLMGLKSPIDSTPSFFGTRIMFALFRRFRSWLPKLYNESIAAIMSSRMIGQHNLKKRSVKPSGHGALFCSMRQIACQISSCEKGRSREDKSTSGGSKISQGSSTTWWRLAHDFDKVFLDELSLIVVFEKPSLSFP
jgi:hypothetical protein